ncbi:MAG: hypothetical protein ABJZ55_10270 [Fuerstiella sp.]
MQSPVWTAVSFFAIATQLVVLRGFDFRQLLLFVVPVLLALAVSRQEPATRGSLLAQIFLGLIAFGLIIAEIPWLFPNLGGVDPNLPRETDRALTWYVAVYLLFFMTVCPFHLFTDSLSRQHQGRPAQFSKFTCWLGLFTASIMCVGMFAGAFRFFGIWPIV